MSALSRQTTIKNIINKKKKKKNKEQLRPVCGYVYFNITPP